MRDGRLREQRALGDCLNHLLGPERDWSNTLNQCARFVNRLGKYYIARKYMDQDVTPIASTY